jgi:hypothetical protein
VQVSFPQRPHPIVADNSSALGTELFRKHLFPDISLDDDEDRLIVPKTPLLNPLTRQTTAEAIFYLVRDDEVQYKTVMGHLAALVPYAGGDDGMPESLLFIAPLSCVLRALCLRLGVPIRQKQVHQISYWIRRTEKSLKHLLSQLPLHAVIYEHPVPRVHA